MADRFTGGYDGPGSRDGGGGGGYRDDRGGYDRGGRRGGYDDRGYDDRGGGGGHRGGGGYRDEPRGGYGDRGGDRGGYDRGGDRGGYDRGGSGSYGDRFDDRGGKGGRGGGGKGGGPPSRFNDDFDGGSRSFANMRPAPPVEKRIEGVVEKAGGYGGRITFGGTDTTPPESIQFGERELPRDGTRLQEGDLVSFVISEDRGGKGGGKGKGGKGSGRGATKIVLVEAGGGLPRFQGVILSVKDKFGFLRQARASGQEGAVSGRALASEGAVSGRALASGEEGAVSGRARLFLWQLDPHSIP